MQEQRRKQKATANEKVTVARAPQSLLPFRLERGPFEGLRHQLRRPISVSEQSLFERLQLRQTQVGLQFKFPFRSLQMFFAGSRLLQGGHSQNQRQTPMANAKETEVVRAPQILLLLRLKRSPFGRCLRLEQSPFESLHHLVTPID